MIDENGIILFQTFNRIVTKYEFYWWATFLFAMQCWTLLRNVPAIRVNQATNLFCWGQPQILLHFALCRENPILLLIVDLKTRLAVNMDKPWTFILNNNWQILSVKVVTEDVLSAHLSVTQHNYPTKESVSAQEELDIAVVMSWF